jgi:hypothetical protein
LPRPVSKLHGLGAINIENTTTPAFYPPVGGRAGVWYYGDMREYEKTPETIHLYETSNKDFETQLIKLATFLNSRLPIDKKSFNEPLFIKLIDELKALLDNLVNHYKPHKAVSWRVRTRLFHEKFNQVYRNNKDLRLGLSYIVKNDLLNIKIK